MKSSHLPVFAILSLSLLVSSAIRSSSAQESQSDDIPGIKVGQKAPSFKLKDQSGNERSLNDLLQEGKLAVVFYRSADW